MYIVSNFAAVLVLALLSVAFSYLLQDAGAGMSSTECIVAVKAAIAAGYRHM